MFESLLETIAGGMNLNAEQIDLIKSLYSRAQGQVVRGPEIADRQGPDRCS